MKFVWSVIGIFVLIYVGVSFWGAVIIVAITWLIVSAATKSGKDNNKQSPKADTGKQHDTEQIINDILLKSKYKLQYDKFKTKTNSFISNPERYSVFSDDNIDVGVSSMGSIM